MLFRSAAILVLAIGVSLPDAQERRVDDRVRVAPELEQQVHQALTAYAAGDDEAPKRWIGTSRRFNHLIALETVVRRTPGWSRSTPAFLLEIAAAGEGAWIFRVPDQLKLGQALLVGRPTPLGADEVEDRFELLWHQAALGVAQGLEQFWLQQDLIDVVRLRFTPGRFDDLLRTSRIPLARAIAAAGLCCWARAAGESVQLLPPSSRRPVTADEALALFEEAAAIPALRVEALIRGAVLLANIGRSADALDWFARVPPHDDRALGYVQHLGRARLLDAADRDVDAAAAYRRALDAEPRSQIAEVGYAAALLRSGRTGEAADAAARARTMAAEVTPHDLSFRRADLRFVPEWLAEIRRLRRNQ